MARFIEGIIMTPNPFALARASDYSDKQINSLWVEIGSAAISRIIDPQSTVSKYILGGKGTGKTHLLRYHSYQVARQRDPNVSGVALLKKYKYLAVFLRATGLDATRFEAGSLESHQWQQLFGVYLELRLVELVLDALCDIKHTSPAETLDDSAFIEHMSRSVNDIDAAGCTNLEAFSEWVVMTRRSIDDAINNAAFTGRLDIRIPFAIGSLALQTSVAIGKWNKSLSEISLIYLIDEIENFSVSQQQVVNSLIRYSEGRATFRVTGRLYGRKTFATLAGGEENREGAEFKTTNLDDILRENHKFPEFSRKFVAKRLSAAGIVPFAHVDKDGIFEPKECFEELDSENLYSQTIRSLRIESNDLGFLKRFESALLSAPTSDSENGISNGASVAETLADEFPPIIQRLNVLLFCKKFKRKSSARTLARTIANDASNFLTAPVRERNYYANAYGHYAADLFAQLCRDSKVAAGVPYAGFDLFVRMASGNPRNLLIILGRAYEIAAFKDIDFVNGPPLAVSIQSDAALESARFMYERDTNYGSDSDLARDAVDRLAVLLRTARYALNIPEVSPLAVSFSNSDLSHTSQKVLHAALNYSYVFEIYEGRPDRNSQNVHRKIQLNPMLSPKWGLPVGRRGDIGLSHELVNAIFDPSLQPEFEALLRAADTRWNSPFRSSAKKVTQGELF
jgi:hypothetical protein